MFSFTNSARTQTVRKAVEVRILVREGVVSGSFCS